MRRGARLVPARVTLACSYPSPTTTAIRGLADKGKKPATSTTSSIPLPDQTVGVYITSAHDHYEHKDVLVNNDQNVRWTYIELLRYVTGWGAGITQARTRRHPSLPHPDRLAIFLPDNTENLVTQLGTAFSGRISAPAAPTTVANLDELSQALKTLSPRHVIFPPEFNGVDSFAKFHELIDELEEWPQHVPLNLRQFPELKLLVNTGFELRRPFAMWRDLMFFDPTPNPMPKPENISPSEIAATYYENGKALAYSHKSLVNSGHVFGQAFGLRTTDRVCVTTPLHKPFCYAGILGAAGHGAVSVLTQPTFDAAKAVETIYRDKCTILLCYPHHLKEMLAHPVPSSHTPTLRKLVIVNEGVDAGNLGELVASAVNKWGVKADTHGDEAVEVRAVGSVAGFIFSRPTSAAAGSLGRPFPHIQAKILSNGSPAKPDVSGDLYVKGNGVAEGYWHATEGMKKVAAADGWLNTGLKAKASSSGEFFLA
jgi:acyl-CoA synthetase (AMP-forming)/AMP-acid ligase II